MAGHSPANVVATQAEPATVGLLSWLVSSLSPRYVIETGCYEGRTSKAIGAALDIGFLDTMDIDEYSVEVARLECLGLPVTVHECSSLEFIPRAPIEFAFLDSDIGDTRLLELERFRPFLAPGATVAIHDARDLWTTWPALDGWRWITLGTPRGLLLLQADG